MTPIAPIFLKISELDFSYAFSYMINELQVELHPIKKNAFNTSRWLNIVELNGI